MRVLLANPRGFCAGVNMAIKGLDQALDLLGAPIYVYHEIIHNKHVVDRFRRRGAVFVDRLQDVPPGATLFYSAHGVSPEVRRLARERRLRTVDATCPLVAKVHREAIHFARQGYTLILIGHEGHDEIVGVLGEAPGRIHLVGGVDGVARLQVADEARVAYLTQTTLSLDDVARIVAALRQRFPGIVGPARGDVCYASQNRQEAVRALLDEVDVVLVLGSPNSFNSRRLREIAAENGKPAYLIDGAAEIGSSWFDGAEVVLVTAGASAPEEAVQACVDYLRDRFAAVVEEYQGRAENVVFPLPRELTALPLISAG